MGQSHRVLSAGSKRSHQQLETTASQQRPGHWLITAWKPWMSFSLCLSASAVVDFCLYILYFRCSVVTLVTLGKKKGNKTKEEKMLLFQWVAFIYFFFYYLCKLFFFISLYCFTIQRGFLNTIHVYYLVVEDFSV